MSSPIRFPLQPTAIRKLPDMQSGFFHNTICRRVMSAARAIEDESIRASWMKACRHVKGERVIHGPPPDGLVYSRLRKYAVLAATPAGDVLCNENGKPVFRKARKTPFNTIILGDPV
jgi:hypothetical protein